MLSACGDDDDDTPPAVIAQFGSAAGTVGEDNAAGLPVTVTLSAEAGVAGTITVELAGATYATDYTTNPDGSSGNFTLDVAAGSAFVGFTVLPIDNDDADGDKTVTVTLSSATGGVELGTGTTFTVTIEDNEEPAPTITLISDLRALYDGSMDVNITDETIIQGVVTSNGDAVTSRNLFIQDASGAIVLRFDESHSFIQGDEIQVDVQGADLSDFNDLVQITNTLPLENAAKVADGTLPTPTVITIAQLNSDDFQAQYVTIENVFYVEADGVEDFGGNNTLSDGTNEAVTRVEGFAPFSDDVLPLGSGSVTGVAGIFAGTPQILPQFSTDVFENNPIGTLTITHSLTAFDQVITGGNSSSQSFTVESTGLVENISVSTSGDFEVSLDDAAFGESVEVDFASSNAGAVTVFVRFSPTSGVSGESSGTISASSRGVVSQSFEVSGEELGASTVIASTSFEEPATGGQYTDTGDATEDHDLVNNADEASVDFTSVGGEIGFDATYVNTRDDVGLTDGDFVGVSDFTGTVGEYTDGTQGYQMSDTDGKMVLTFDQVSLTGFTNYDVRLDIFVQSTGWESDDAIRVYLIVDGGAEVDLLNTAGLDIDDDFADLEGAWSELATSLNGNSEATLVVELDCNSGSEAIYLDKVEFTGRD